MPQAARSPHYARFSVVTDSDVKWFEVIGVHGDLRPKNIRKTVVSGAGVRRVSEQRYAKLHKQYITLPYIFFIYSTLP